MTAQISFSQQHPVVSKSAGTKKQKEKVDIPNKDVYIDSYWAYATGCR
jgi:hypothetical protein